MTQTRPETIQTLEPGLRRVLAPNPSPMTYWGTNTYILGEGSVVVIDPGPADRIHLEAIKSALKPGETVSHILVTHSHLDHSPLAPLLARETGAPVLAFGDSQAGRSAVMRRLSLHKAIGGGEGVDAEFRPDETLVDGAEIIGAGWSIRAIWTPGHFGNHLCFAWKDAVFSGDHVMGWASSLVSPPDGDLTAFMASTRKLAARSDRIFYPGHGAPIADPKARIDWLIGHRETREAAILAALSGKARTVQNLTVEVYHDTPAALLPAAERNLFAHLVDLTERGIVRARPALSFTADFTRL
jgi:glyoxylase-like metal-dependent hydrolase (beta-lactamase superfamily II)